MIKIKQNGYMIYYSGKLRVTHRPNGLPAAISTDGTKEYWENGNPHRANGLPACEYADGSKSYYENGKLHRANGLPACEYADGSEEYYENGLRHRANGQPAIVHHGLRKNFHNPSNKNIGRYVYKKTIINITDKGEIFYGIPNKIC